MRKWDSNNKKKNDKRIQSLLPFALHYQRHPLSHHGSNVFINVLYIFPSLCEDLEYVQSTQSTVTI